MTETGSAPTERETSQDGSKTEQQTARTRYAAIDIGTNSVKMLAAELKSEIAQPILDRTTITRLGEGMEANGRRLREAAMRRTLDALEELVSEARTHGVSHISAVGTAALRDASNQADFVRRAREQCKLEVEPIPGEEEARLSFLAVRRDAHWKSCRNLLVIDIGGGSTEVIQGANDGDRIATRQSIGQGAVRLTESCLKSDPPTIQQLARANQVAGEAFGDLRITSRKETFTLVGVGGTVTNLGAMDQQGKEPADLHGHVLSADHLEKQIALLAGSTVEQRKEIAGLDPRRADIILGGAILLSIALARLGVSSVSVSTRGLRWGLLYDRFRV